MAGKGKVGRPQGSLVISDLQPHIITLLKSGVPIAHVCDAVGIDTGTYYVWMRKGEAAKTGQYRDFYLAAKKARADAVARNVALVQKAAADSWQAAAWWLERCHPHEFGRGREVEVNVTQNNVEVNITDTRERITSRINSIAARIGKEQTPE